MKNEKLANALNEIDDTYIAQAATPRKRRPSLWIGAVAALLAVILTVSLLPGTNPSHSSPNLEVPHTTGSTGTTSGTQGTTGTQPSEQDPSPNDKPSPNTGGIDLSPLQALPDLLRAPTVPQLVQHPNPDEYAQNWELYGDALDAWQASQNAQHNQPEGYADSLYAFFYRSIQEFLSTDKNSAYSPVNVYMAMAMLAETTDGNSRQQILDLFGVGSIEELRTQAYHMWNAHYNDDSQTTLLLGNSLWLDHAYTFHQDTVDRLADHYYASVFTGDLGTQPSNQQLQTWLDVMTGGLLSEQAKNVELRPEAVFALASTIYFKAGWEKEFPETGTADGTFHTPSGDVTVPFMHNYVEGTYYRGSNFGAIALELTGYNRIWIILPDEGISLAEVMAGDEYLRLTSDPNSWENTGYYTLDIKLPKFDVTSQSDLIVGMKNLGLTDIFDSNVSDFTPMTRDSDQLFVSQINHAARVVIDEKGVIAAAFTVIEVGDEGAGPNIFQFTVDRPFLFIVSSQDHLPLFVGTVTNP